ncbi:hypothetical protein MPL3356_270094 [Mesorhizobium plurifarium]|uniref:Uncharacterized protein n=1 Tax=Mesorhizobium plurifarium TaxID=69974 RepID=A0A090DUN1_MESPL|nr:hypothetical protein MPL3356_270094 [Mesorhizobium plurifarium]
MRSVIVISRRWPEPHANTVCARARRSRKSQSGITRCNPLSPVSRCVNGFVQSKSHLSQAADVSAPQDTYGVNRLRKNGRRWWRSSIAWHALGPGNSASGDNSSQTGVKTFGIKRVGVIYVFTTLLEIDGP